MHVCIYIMWFTFRLLLKKIPFSFTSILRYKSSRILCMYLHRIFG